MNLEQKEQKISGYPMQNKTQNQYVFHKKTNGYYEILFIDNVKKTVKVLYKKGIFNHYKKFNFDEIIILNSTHYRDSFGHEIYENSLIRDFKNDEYGTVKFGLYQDENDKEIMHYGYYILWENNSNSRKKEFEFWIKEGIQLVDLLNRKSNFKHILKQETISKDVKVGE